jgi:hypothetical protein
VASPCYTVPMKDCLVNWDILSSFALDFARDGNLFRSEQVLRVPVRGGEEVLIRMDSYTLECSIALGYYVH